MEKVVWGRFISPEKAIFGVLIFDDFLGEFALAPRVAGEEC
jgi:hypothetical protein